MSGYNLHIWERKEIENYAINPDVIYRYIQANKRKGKITVEIVKKKMIEMAEEMKEVVREKIANEIQKKDKGLDFSSANRFAAKRMKDLWKCPFNVIPGKQFIKNLSSWSKKEYGVSFQAVNLILCFKPEEIPEEIKNVISAIVEGKRI